MISTRIALLLLFVACASLTAATPPARHPAPVTLVAHPWATVSINEGEPRVLPSTVLLEPGEYRLSIQRDGYRTMRATIRVVTEEPQHHVFRLLRR